MPTVICSLRSGAIVSIDKEHSKFIRWKVTLKMCASSLSLSSLLLVESILCFIRNDKAQERRERGFAEDYCLLYMYTEDDQVMEYHHNV